jgi:HD-GYP domain-containing protein (c-di-GMP phosphodiesterase class II)
MPSHGRNALSLFKELPYGPRPHTPINSPRSPASRPAIARSAAEGQPASWMSVFGVVRPVVICVAAIAMAAVAMTVSGWQVATLLLGIVLALLACMLIFQVHRAASRLRDQSAAIQSAAAQAEEHYADVLAQMVHFAEARDRYLDGHSARVGQLAGAMASSLGLSPSESDMMERAGRLHDVGLLAIPAGTLGERRRISAESFRGVKEHCQIGFDILSPLAGLGDALGAIRHHHERMNGTGYPDGLAGEAVPLGARVLAVADTYDAMTHDRPHRGAIAPSAALAELRRCSPAGYDSRCVEALAEVLVASGQFLDAAPNRVAAM